MTKKNNRKKNNEIKSPTEDPCLSLHVWPLEDNRTSTAKDPILQTRQHSNQTQRSLDRSLVEHWSAREGFH